MTAISLYICFLFIGNSPNKRGRSVGGEDCMNILVIKGSPKGDCGHLHLRLLHCRRQLSPFYKDQPDSDSYVGTFVSFCACFLHFPLCKNTADWLIIQSNTRPV